MTTRIPTELGDVLILRTDHSFTLHVVGAITLRGQQDFDTYPKANPHARLQRATDRAAAIAAAKALLVPGRRIFFRHLETGEWSEISS